MYSDSVLENIKSDNLNAIDQSSIDWLIHDK